MEKQSLRKLIGKHVLGVLGTYQQGSDKMDVYICGVEIPDETHLKLNFPKGHTLTNGQLVTLHLDNRTGVSEYDAELSVYRLSYKANVRSVINQNEVVLDALEYQVFYGISAIKTYIANDYQFPEDVRQTKPLPLTPLVDTPRIDEEEHDNKIGVLLTYASQQPHTTVMAFLSSVDDDIFFITLSSTFKGLLLQRDNRCYFAIDGRASFTFEHAIEWNYSIIQGSVYHIPKNSEVFAQLRELFITKNPWEMGFFSHPDIEMYHLKAEHAVCPKIAPPALQTNVV